MRRILSSQLCRYRKAAEGFSLMNISKLKNFPAFGRWATARRFPTARPGFHPPTAQHAIREGRSVAHNVAADILRGRKRPFRFSTLGRLAAIGRRSGVANGFGLDF